MKLIAGAFFERVQKVYSKEMIINANNFTNLFTFVHIQR